MTRIEVALGHHSYPIYVGEQLLAESALFQSHLCGRQILIVSNDTVAPLYVPDLARHFNGKGFTVAHHILPDGEQYKTLEQIEAILTTLLQQNFHRDCCLVAVGGGVVGDTAGFAAACYQRGVACIQVPTSLLAQVDSSVGGKTGVNHPLGKNMIGAFHQPVAVVADTGVLSTLPEREYRSGLAEVIKYGLIRDRDFFVWLESHMDALLCRDPSALRYAVEQSCRHKMAVVAADERESGVRATLNLGHTFGHAIETALGYRHWLHGEAVACGMVMAARLSLARKDGLDATSLARIEALLRHIGLPTSLPSGLDAAQLLECMKRDKKVKNGRIVLILLEAIGSALIVDDCLEASVLAVLS